MSEVSSAETNCTCVWEGDELKQLCRACLEPLPSKEDLNLVSGLTKLGNKEGESWVTLREAEAEAVCAELSKLHEEHLQDIERMDRAATAIEAYQAKIKRLTAHETTDQCLRAALEDIRRLHEPMGGNVHRAVVIGIVDAALGAPEKARAYGPGMTPHADDCECYVCAEAVYRETGHYPTCGVGEGTHRGPCDCSTRAAQKTNEVQK